MKRRARIVSAMLVSAFITQAAGCGGTSQSAAAQDAQAKAWVDRALRVVASEYQDFHNYDLVSAFTLRNLDHSLRAVSSLRASGSGSTFTVSARSASGTTFEMDGTGLSLTRLCRPASTDCPGGHWPGSLTLAVAPTAPTPRLTAAQEAEVRRILLSSATGYAELLRRGQRILGTTQYPNAQAGLNAFSDPTSAASQFGAYQKDANVYGSAPYLDAFKRADRFFTAANEPQAMTNWEDDMAQVQGDLAQWIKDDASWQISEVQTSVLQADIAAFEADLAKARADAVRVTPGGSGVTSSTSPVPRSTGSTTTAGAVARGPAGRCADVEFRNPYTGAIATARVAVRNGTATCAVVQALISATLSVKHPASGGMWQSSVDGWLCSSGGEGTIDVCTRQADRVVATTPTPGGYWAAP